LRRNESELLLSSANLRESEVLEALNKLRRPVTSSELGKELGVSGQVAGAHLYRLAARGATLKVTSDKPSLWIGDDEIVRGLVQAFPVMIAFYKRRNPAHVKFLEAEWEQLLKRGFAEWRIG